MDSRRNERATRKRPETWGSGRFILHCHAEFFSSFPVAQLQTSSCAILSGC